MSKIEVDAIDKQSGSTLTLGGSGTAVTLACGATQTGFGRTGTVDWQTTPKTATFTAVNGEGYFCNTTGGAFTVNLPAGSAGAIISVADYAGTWQTNALTVSPNGTDKIGGVNGDVSLNTEGQSVTFIFVDSTQGWINTMDSTSNVRSNPFIVATGGTITTSGNDKIHTFTGPGTFSVTNIASCAAQNIVSYLAVAGGGGGGNNLSGGGGGGGFRELESPTTPYTSSPLDGYPSAPNRVSITATAFPITVGAGGAARNTPSCGANGLPGSVSTFSTISSAGGGGGGGGDPGTGTGQGQPGGSGGGSSGYAPAPTSGGTGNTPPTTPAQGTNGGNGGNAGPGYPGAGGGGATAAGATPPNSTSAGSAGGAGAQTQIDTNNYYYSGGGGGGSYSNSPAGGAGGLGGGGGGGTCTPVGAGGAGGGTARNPGSPGTASPPSGPSIGGDAGANTGGGGGGAGHASGNADGGSGGSGIVIIRYKFQ